MNLDYIINIFLPGMIDFLWPWFLRLLVGLIAWNSFVPSVLLVCFLSLIMRIVKQAVFLLNTRSQGRLELNLKLSYSKYLEHYDLFIIAIFSCLLPTIPCVFITKTISYLIIHVFSVPIMLLFVLRFCVWSFIYKRMGVILYCNL